MKRWLIVGPNGEREQVCTRGERTPSEDGSNPNGWREIPVNRHGDLARETFDEESRRWKHDPALEVETERQQAESWLARLPPGVIEILAERVAARLKAKEE